MFAAIADIIGEAVVGIVEVWESIKEIKVVGRFATGAKCTVEWYAWISSTKLVINKMKSVGLPADMIVKTLGLEKIFKLNNLEDIEKKIANNLDRIQPAMQNLKELTERVKMAKSPWAGAHKPPYDSIAISEVLYDFSNVAGTGTMIIMFNPAGFGNKPKAPQIVRYVQEDEFAEFINSKSWGNYWRINYLLRQRSRTKFRRSERTKDILTDEEDPVPKSESLDDYIERVLDLPEYADDIIAGEFSDLINDALSKSIDQSEMMQRAIEEGDIGRGLEERGLRVTSIISDREKQVPYKLRRLVTSDPIFRDVAKVTANYKQFITRIRGLRDGFNNAANLWSLSAEAGLVAEQFGAVATLQLQMNLRGQIPTVTFLQETGLITSTAGKAAVYKKIDHQVAANMMNDYLRKKKTGKVWDYASYQRSWKSEAKRRGGKIMDRKQGLWVESSKGKSEEYWLSRMKTKDVWEKEQAVRLAKKEKALLAEELEAAGLKSFAWKRIIKPPTCVPFL